jgi:hypothetical protein
MISRRTDGDTIVATRRFIEGQGSLFLPEAVLELQAQLKCNKVEAVVTDSDFIDALNPFQ